jgi:membrane protein YdbS with pleckstrin-like domain
MYDRLRTWVLHVMRVPHDPEPPFGAPGSIRVFRAGKNLYHLRLVRWGFTQFLALAGIIFWVTVFIQVEAEVRERHQAMQVRINPKEARDFKEYLEKIGAAKPDASATPAVPEQKAKLKPRTQINGWAGFKLVLVQMALWLPPWAFPVIWVLKTVGIVAYLAQLPFTYLLVRFDYEMRWYMVTDRSLRIRYGVWKVNESTMSFANLQQVEVKQGPLQRLLKLADVHVQSAGGGGDHDPRHGKAEDALHTGIFHSVENATEIRDLILERLRHFRQAGLGDPDDHHDHPSAPAPVAPADALGAAQELLAEARALRATLS